MKAEFGDLPLTINKTCNPKPTTLNHAEKSRQFLQTGGFFLISYLAVVVLKPCSQIIFCRHLLQ